MNQLIKRQTNKLAEKKKKGFTLVELIIVIAIIAILAAIALPKFTEIRENANVKTDIATAKAIQSAVTVAVTNGDTGFGFGTDATHPNIIDSGELAPVLNGNSTPIPKSKEAKDGTFTAEIDNNGNVVVKAKTFQVLPKPAAVDANNPYSK